MKSAKFVIDGTGLEFDRNYGAENRTGWTAVRDGCVRIQFVPLYRAAWALFRSLRLDAEIGADAPELFASDMTEEGDK